MDHDGECSDDECSPSARLVMHTMKVPDGVSVELGEIVSHEVLKLLCIPHPVVNTHGSFYCTSDGSPWDDVNDQHDYGVDAVCGMGID